MTGTKSKYQHEIDQFNNAFSRFKDKRIILYGIGRYTATILSELGGTYTFSGLMDKDPKNIGKTIYNVRVISLNDAEELGDIIIINTQEMYWRIIFQRIKESRIPVYYKNGQQATDDSVFSTSNDPYWNINAGYIYKKAQGYDVISFDIFDTLITRKVLTPKDVFLILEKRAKENGIRTSIAEFRTRINTDVIQNLYSYEDIYNIMQERLSLSDQEVEWLKNEEMKLERELSSPRGPVIELFNRLSEEKECYLVSDMYYQADFIYSLLENAGIKKHVPIWISCEKGATKKTGDLWKEYKEFIGNRRALHIGDNQKSDIENSKEYEIDSVRVLSPFSLWERSSLSRLLSQISDDEEIWAGLIAEKLFADPFSLSKTKGNVIINDTVDAGYVIFGALIYTFLNWIMCTSRSTGGRVFFFSRDGYWLIEDYNYLNKLIMQNKKALKAEEAEYLAISRKVALVSLIDEEEGWEKLLSFPFVGSFKYYAKIRLDFDVPWEDANVNKQIMMPADYSKVERWLAQYKETILEKLKKEKANYMKYISSKNISEKDFVVDLWFNGNNQYYLSRLVHTKLSGLYIAANMSKTNKCAENNILHACFQETEDILAEKSFIYKQSAFIEAFLTAPYGMISYVDENGKFICAPNKENQKRWSTRCEMNEGVKQFMEEYVSQGDDTVSPAFINMFWKEVFDGNIRMDSSIQKDFFHDNALIKEQEEMVFE